MYGEAVFIVFQRCGILQLVKGMMEAFGGAERREAKRRVCGLIAR